MKITDHRTALAALRRGYLELSAAVTRLSHDVPPEKLRPYYARLGQIRRALEKMATDVDALAPTNQRVTARDSWTKNQSLMHLAKRVYVAKLDAYLDKAEALLANQRARIADYELGGPVPTASRDLLIHMTNSVELLRWQKAVADWESKDLSVTVPGARRTVPANAPSNVLALICEELRIAANTGAAANDPVNEAVKIVMRKEAGPCT